MISLRAYVTTDAKMLCRLHGYDLVDVCESGLKNAAVEWRVYEKSKLAAHRCSHAQKQQSLGDGCECLPQQMLENWI